MNDEEAQSKVFRNNGLFTTLRSRKVLLPLCLFALVTVIVLVKILPKPRTVLYDAKSEVNGKVLITDEGHGNIREIRFCDPPCVRQSSIKYGEPTYLGLAYAPRMIAALTLAPREPRQVLLLGLGGGNLPNFILHTSPHVSIDVVEMDPQVVHATKTYLGFPPPEMKDRVNMFVSEGMEWFNKNRGRAKYDVILADACAGIPCALTTVETYRLMRDTYLSKDGVVLQNVYGYQWRVFRNMQEVFKYVYIIPCRLPQVNVVAIGSQKRLTRDYMNAFRLWRFRTSATVYPESLKNIEEAMSDVIDLSDTLLNEPTYTMADYLAKRP